jgi:hypothetical protein
VKPLKTSHFRHVLNDGFIHRLYRVGLATLETMFDGESVWEEFVNSLDEQSRPDHFRLNISLPQSAVIDDVGSMEQLRETVRFHPTASAARLEIARALLVSCFYFELDQAPVHDYETGRYRVQGSIKCRSNSYDVVEALENVEIFWVEYATDAGVLSNRGSAREDICPVCHRYRHNVQFYIRDPTDKICIYMKSGNNFRRKLSGFPQRLKWFEEQQELDQPFGTSSHGSPGLLYCRTCRSRAGLERAGKRNVEYAPHDTHTRKRLRV